jgi:hypothetical protein
VDNDEHINKTNQHKLIKDLIRKEYDTNTTRMDQIGVKTEELWIFEGFMYFVPD